MNGIIEITPDAVTQKALNVPEQAAIIKITDSQTYEAGCNVLLVIKDLRKEIDAAFDPIIKKAHEAHKEAVMQKKKADAPLCKAEGIIKPKIALYQAEQEHIRRKEELRLRREAEKAEEERRLAEAVEAEKAGDKELAEEIIAAPVEVAPVILAKTTPKVAGVVMKEIWKFEVTDINQIPREYMMPDLTKIGGVVRALKGQTKIAGVKVYAENNIAAGRK